MAAAASYDRHGPARPLSPVVLSVPHAGRDYPPAVRTMLSAPFAALQTLEDRHVDAVALAAHGREALFVQRIARAWIDLNRGEDERDPRVDVGAKRIGGESLRLRSGLGVVPRRAPGFGDVWNRRLYDEEVRGRLAQHHRPYHAAVADALAAARAVFGVAVLVDLHSMPPLGTGKPQLVFGDRFGRSAAPQYVQRLEEEARAAGLRHGLNVPYAGGHVIDRHGQPASHVHAVQIELDRALYLDPALDRPGEGLARTAAVVRRMIDALADEAVGGGQLLAAE